MEEGIRQAIRQGDFFIACFSQEWHSRVKCYMNEELTLAIEELRKHATDRAWFLPVLLSECNVPARSIGAGETLLDLQWIALYEDWDAGVRRLVDVIQPPPPGLTGILNALHCGDARLSERAFEALCDWKDRAGVPALIALVKADQGAASQAAASALGKIGDSRAVGALTVALRSDDTPTGAEAALALGKIGHVAGVPSLMQAATQEVEYAVIGLGMICAAVGIPSVVEALKDEEWVFFWAHEIYSVDHETHFE